MSVGRGRGGGGGGGIVVYKLSRVQAEGGRERERIYWMEDERSVSSSLKTENEHLPCVSHLLTSSNDSILDDLPMSS
jgi:hypothetical protein